MEGGEGVVVSCYVGLVGGTRRVDKTSLPPRCVHSRGTGTPSLSRPGKISPDHQCLHNLQSSVRIKGFGKNHRVYRVPEFLAGALNWRPHPLHRKRVCLPPRIQVEGEHTRLREGGGGEPMQTKGQTLWYSVYYNTFSTVNTHR